MITGLYFKFCVYTRGQCIQSYNSGGHCIAVTYYTIIGGYVECRGYSQGAAQDSTGTAQDGSQTRTGDTINASMLSKYHQWLHKSFNI